MVSISFAYARATTLSIVMLALVKKKRLLTPLLKFLCGLPR